MNIIRLNSTGDIIKKGGSTGGTPSVPIIDIDGDEFYLYYWVPEELAKKVYEETPLTIDEANTLYDGVSLSLITYLSYDSMHHFLSCKSRTVSSDGTFKKFSLSFATVSGENNELVGFVIEFTRSGDYFNVAFIDLP